MSLPAEQRRQTYFVKHDEFSTMVRKLTLNEHLMFSCPPYIILLLLLILRTEAPSYIRGSRLKKRRLTDGAKNSARWRGREFHKLRN